MFLLIIAKMLDLAGSGNELTKASSVNPKPPEDDGDLGAETLLDIVVVMPEGAPGWKDWYLGFSATTGSL